MNREHVLEHLSIAKLAHIKWVEKAKLLIDGIDVKKDLIPVDSRECKFGKWFYSDGQLLNSLSNNPLESMEKIEQLHSRLHEVYKSIFNIYFNESKEGFFAKLFANKKEISEDDTNKAKQYYIDLERISKELLEEISRLERRLVAISEEKIQQLV